MHVRIEQSRNKGLPTQAAAKRRTAAVHLGVLVLAASLLSGPAAAAGLGAKSLEGPAAGASLVHRIAVFGEDGRKGLPARYRALESKIGLIYDTRSRTVCTAFCVSETMVATAAHCLYRTAGERPPRLTDFTFRILAKGRGSVTPLAGAASGSVGQNIVAGSSRLSVHPPIDATNDWAIAKLAAPACTAGGLRISRRAPAVLAAPAESNPVYQIAFHRDFVNWKLAYDAPCGVAREFHKANWDAVARDFRDPERLMLHTCDTGGASSGSPLLVDGPSGPEVIGINVGTYVQSRVLIEKGEVVHRYKADTVANTGVSTAAFLPALELFSRAEIIAGRTPLKSLQGLLAKAGLYTGPIDGIYGPALKQAIAAFELQEGRVVTGIASTQILQRVTASLASRTSPAVAQRPAPLETGSVGHATQTAARPR